MNSKNYQALLKRLDGFIRKYYTNKLIRGSILLVSSSLFFFLLLANIEYFGQFESTVRTVLMLAYVVSVLSLLYFWIIVPLLKLYGLKKALTYNESAKLIGEHFSAVNDRLLNTLELHQAIENEGGSPEQLDLIHASIEQRAQELSPVPFKSAINFGENKRYLKFLMVPVVLVVLILSFQANILTEGANRLIHYNTNFEEQAYFSFEVLNEKFDALEQEDFTVEVKLIGENEIPAQVMVQFEGKSFTMQGDKKNRRNFTYTFKNIQRSTDFQLFADGLTSKPYRIEVLPNPLLLNFNVQLSYPKYTGRVDEKLNNKGDLIVPEGTRVAWSFNTKNTDRMNMRMNDTLITLTSVVPNVYNFKHLFSASTSYSLVNQNEFASSKDSIKYNVQVIPDLYPTIEIEERHDTLNQHKRFFSGQVKDDYGFTKLTFNYRIVSDKNNAPKFTVEALPVNGELQFDKFYHYWDISAESLNPGDVVEYFFQVWDNDGFNGVKSTKSAIRTYRAPSIKELEEKTESTNEEIKSDLEKSMKAAQELKEEFKKTQEDLLQKDKYDWQDKKQIENLLQQQQDLQKAIEEIKEKTEQNHEKQAEFKEVDEELKKKQEQLEKLMDEVLTDEMKELLEELQEMMEEMNQEQVHEKLQEMNMSTEEMEKELDRALELFKRMEFEQNLEELNEKVEQLKEEQEQLNEETQDKSNDTQELQEKQEQLNEEFKDIQEKFESLEEKNEALEKPHKMEDSKKQQESIQEHMEKSSEELQNDKRKKASEQQQQATEQMQQLSEQLQSMQSNMQMQSLQINMAALRELLENLIQLSFDQEELMEELHGVKKDDPRYVTLAQNQKKIKDDAELVKDSLFALSKEVTILETTVNKEINDINLNLDKTLNYMGERKTRDATNRQQKIMTSVNNLALLLDDALQKMQQQMASQMPGQGQCQKPGGANPNGNAGQMPSLKELQEQLNKQLQQMKEQLSKQPGGQQPGGQQFKQMPGLGEKSGNSPGLSQQLSKLAQQQSEIRDRLEKLSDQLRDEGKGTAHDLKKITDDMEQTEKDILNQNITPETIRRQQDILTRLLEAENAERERGFDEKRESKEAREIEESNPKEFLEYKRQKEQEVEMLKTIPPALKPYYKEKVNSYFNQL